MLKENPIAGEALASYRSTILTRLTGLLGAGALVTPSLADVLIDHTFDGVANDIGPAFQEVTNTSGNGGSSDLTTGLITTSDRNDGTWGFNTVATVDVLTLDPAAVGFTATYEFSSTAITRNIANLASNGLFFGVVSGTDAAGAGATSLWNNNPDSFGFSAGSTSYTDHAMRQDGNTNFALPTPAPSNSSFADGATISISVFNDDSWRVTSTGLIPELVGSGTLNATDFTYADIINDLGLFVSLQGEAGAQINMDRMTLESLDTIPGDTVAPYLTTLAPGGESGVALDSNLVATFSEEIAIKAGGTITLTDLDDGSGTTVISLPDARVSVSGAELTINPSADLEIANYEVTISGLSIEDTAGSPNDFFGTVSGQWVFSTFSIPPTVVGQDVAGEGVIGDEVLTTSGGTATLTTQAGSHWRSDGGDGGGAPEAFSSLTSPTVVVPTSGAVTLSFNHRYNFESDFDGGAVFVSINGGAATYLAPGAFTQNGYVGDVQDTVWPGDGGGRSDVEVFTGASAGNGLPTLIPSVAGLGSLNAGDTIAVEFRGGWDTNTFPAGTNWEIGAVAFTDSVGTAFLDADFSANGTDGFTAVTTAVNPNFAGGWEYANVQLTFEIDADTLTADRFAPDIAGSVIDLNGADILVELIAGTLDAGDEFSLFDLSGGTTLSGSISSLTLPPGVWDSSTLAVDGKLILLLPEASGPVATPGADFFVNASQDLDTGDGRGPDFADGNPTGFDVILDSTSGVTQVPAVSANFPRITSAYDLPGGGLTGIAGGIHMSSNPTGNDQRSFQEAVGDWSNEDVSIEMWFKPDSLTPVTGTNTNGQILFEDGGGTGLGIFLDDSGELQVRKAPGGGIVSYNIGTDPSGLLAASATTEFIQVVATYDVNPGTVGLFINGVQITPSGTNNASPAGGDWSGGDGAGIGTRGDANVGGIGGGQQLTETFDGQIAIFRVYRAQLLTEPQVAANYTEITTPDTTSPVYTSLSPSNLATGVFFEDALVATFSEAIELTGLGSVTLRNLDTMSDTVISLPDAQVTATGNQLTIDPSTALGFDTNYAVLISADAIEDRASTPNLFGGIIDETRWTFTTDAQDLTNPTQTSLSPANTATEVQALDSLVVTFDEDVQIATGNITLKNLTKATQSTISITDGTQVSLVGNVLTINPSSTLAGNSDYAVQIEAGVVNDISGNPYDGILDDTTWSFRTGNFEDILFSDTFNRPNSTDLNASAAGKAGTLGILDWGSTTVNSLLDINGNTLRTDNNASLGTDGAWAWVEQNFIGLSTMSITLDISAQSSAGDGRFSGFRMGQSLADISGETSGSPGGQVADIGVYLDNIGATRGIVVYEGSTSIGNFTVPQGVGVLSAVFTFADMGAGSALNYEVFFNGSSVTTGSTTWSGTNENYVSVHSNTTNATRFNSIQVTGSPGAGGADYAVWSGSFPGANLSDPDGDFDGDGLSNDNERLFGLDPTNASSVDPISVLLDPAVGTFSFTRRDDALTGRLTDIETSTDLVTWTVDNGAILVEGIPDGNGVEEISVTLSPDLLTSEKLFVRVNQERE